MAARHRLPQDSQLFVNEPIPLIGVIVLGGVPDLKAFREQGISTCKTDVVGKHLGDSEDQVEQRYKETSPKELLPLGVPQVLIYGTEDSSVPVALARSYIKAAEQKGDSVQLIEVEDVAHHEYNVPNSMVWPTIKSVVHSLLDGKMTS